MKRYRSRLAAVKAFAKARGFEGRKGGWIYNRAGRPVAHGWDSFAAYLHRTGDLAYTGDPAKAQGPDDYYYLPKLAAEQSGYKTGGTR